MGSPPGQGRLLELAGDPLHAFFSSAMIADFPADHEHLVHDQVVVAPAMKKVKCQLMVGDFSRTSCYTLGR